MLLADLAVLDGNMNMLVICCIVLDLNRYMSYIFSTIILDLGLITVAEHWLLMATTEWMMLLLFPMFC
jgi:hypothetical protein